MLLQGYASILAELARYVVDQGISMPKALKGVYSTAEVLYDWQRQLMEQAFGCKVFKYGSREVPNMAVECRHGNQHIFTDDEIIRKLWTRVSTEVDEQMTLNVIQTDEIPRTISGKHRFVISYAAD